MAWLTHSPALGEDAGEHHYTISDLAQEFGTTLRALRFYEQKGLIKPRRDGRARLYSRLDRDRLALVLKGKRLGFTLGEIAAMIAGRDQGGDGTLDLSRQKCVDQIRMLERQKREIEEAISELRQIYSSFYINAPKITSD